jgi:hypothetical protein
VADDPKFRGAGVMETDWDALEQALRGCEPVTDAECAYLKKAFVATERMWAENVSKVAEVRFVMLAESPQFGAGERYFYNTATPFSSFFHFDDAESILGRGFANGRTDKQFLLAELARAGFVILDIFPFALNQDDTPSVKYEELRRRPRRYRELFQRTASLYFDKKRDLILQHGSPLFLFRYGHMKRTLGAFVDAELAKRNIGATPSIGSKNMPLDRGKLRQICHVAWAARV